MTASFHPHDPRIQAYLDWKRLNHGRDDDEDWGEEDALDDLAQECGLLEDGFCTLAGTEYCDWECPFAAGGDSNGI